LQIVLAISSSKQYTPDFIHSDAWPPNSPDLNPLDYCVWNALKELVYAGRRKPFLNTDELKQVIEAKWSLLDDRQIQKSVGQWKQRLRAVTREGGGSIKHLFAYNVSVKQLCKMLTMGHTVLTTVSLKRLIILR